MDDNEDRLAALEEKVDTVVYLVAEKLYKERLLAARQILNNPAVRDALANRLAESTQ